MDVIVKVTENLPQPRQETISTTTKTQTGPQEPKLDPKNIQKFILDTHAEAVKSFESKFYRKSLEAFNILLKLGVDVHGCYLNIGTIYMISEKFQLAVEHLQKAIEANPSDWSQYSKLGESYFGLKKYLEAKKAFEKGLDHSNDEATTIHLKSWIGKCLFQQNQLNQAIAQIQPILETHPKNIFALELYAEILFSQNIPEDLIPILLNLIAQNKSNRVKEMLTDCIQKHGVSKLVGLLGEQASPQILSFIATVIKEFGAIQESMELYQIVCSKSDNVSYMLNLVHVIELTLEYDKAIQTILKYFSQHLDLTLGGVSCKDLHDLCLNGQVPQINYKISTKYSTDELNLLALMFTLVKVTYLSGNLKLVDSLISVIIPLQIDNLHLTLIRNENAYFSEMTELMKIRRDHNVQEKSKDAETLYICGDSHCLTPAWNTMHWKGKEQILIPRLVTGLKCWHLRRESRFYPKVNFWNAIHSIPKGSNVVFLFGEIDCREGILLAVEKLKYESIEEGITHVIDIYMEILKDLKSRFKIIVHPVLPVLDITRSMVNSFNKILKEKCHQNDIKHLDFAGELLGHDGTLKKEYELDGTHIHPGYLKVFENYMNK